MATRLETPRMMPSMVSRERNLCAQISRNPVWTVIQSWRAGEVSTDYLVGFFGRLFTELMTPGDLLRMVRADIDRAPRP